MGATLDRSAAIGQQAITISGPAARRGGPAAGRCVARMGTQAAHAHLHEIECVERLALARRARNRPSKGHPAPNRRRW